MPEHVKETILERDIVEWLVEHGGYTEGFRDDFDARIGLDPVDFLAFVADTQEKSWRQLIHRYGGDEAQARTNLIQRVVDALGRYGTVEVLRRGVDDKGVAFKLVFFKPASGRNPALLQAYGRNRLAVTRQVRYSTRHGKTVDLTFFINGLPVATAELKNRVNRQTVDDAIRQYQQDRDAADLMLGARAVVHFAVDDHLAYMTTELAGDASEFLPFNRGSHPGELSCGKGNPPNSKGYAVSYLWEQVWRYDAWLDIFARFVEQIEETDENGRKYRRTLFPRFHQWDAVLRVAADVAENGPGHLYLVQHSAGSGKSKTIAWLSHRLSLLHDADDDQVFGKVIVVTDRRALDEQLRTTVRQFERVPGTMVAVEGKTGSKSAELAEALRGNAQIITVTLETFPFLLRKIQDDDFASNSYAVVVDEAHSSQTGDAAAALKQAIGAGMAEGDAEDAAGPDTDSDRTEGADVEEALNRLVAARGRQPNLSFFAFTATPKERTVELFGTADEDGNKEPFHLYTMRQAIEEGFILDVLRNYTTYDTYFRLATTPDVGEEEVDVREASASIRRFVSRNPVMIQQKASIIVEHFRTHTKRAIGGRAKAMVVTDSRAAAVGYKRAIDRHVAEEHITDVRALVALSGKIRDDLGEEVTEASLNGFPDSQTVVRFKGEKPFSPGDYQVLIVAEKFQTGFDAPHLHTMFVDKPLKGLNAVQTLSRLNRIAPGKEETFILDFRNTVEEIEKAFQPYYEGRVVQPSDPNVLYDLRRRIDAVAILDPEEVRAASDAYFGTDPSKRALKLIYANVDPAVERFEALDESGQQELRDAAHHFVRAYAFLSQVMPFTDLQLERLYVYLKAFLACVPSRSTGGLNLGKDLVLTHLRIERRATEEIDLEPGAAVPGSVFFGDGHGKEFDSEQDRLWAVIEEINERYGADLDDNDQLEVEKIKQRLLRREDLSAFARVNAFDHYALEFSPVLKNEILEQEERNRRLYDLFASRPEIADMVEAELMRETYDEFNQRGSQASTEEDDAEGVEA
jgi:type I restriction enzyme R subunit